ncbi:MAG: DUF4276 family protein [Muribaculum sp.]|nr:DUF4276 family protein [Muribaculum sp.]
MKFIILNVLCEGPTEERFVKKVLTPFLQKYNIFPKTVLLTTSRKKNAYGGMISYTQAKRDLELCMRKYTSNDSELHLFTTMFDYYALPNDFPGYHEADKIQDVRIRINHLEQAFAADINHRCFIPYLQLHEFEAILFTDIEKLKVEYPKAEKEIIQLKESTELVSDPELINNHPDTAPSKRIIRALKNKYNYDKVKSGSATAAYIGIENILNSCQHFREWINILLSSNNL